MADSDDPISRILHAADPGSSDELLPLVYDDLRRIARTRLAHDAPGQTRQPTALVHEACLRVAGDGGLSWDGRRHFFAAAAEAMRRILIDKARRRASVKHGGGRVREELSDSRIEDRLRAIESPVDDVLSVAQALESRLADRIWER